MKHVILIGDSIRKGYDQYVKMALEGVAEVGYPKENCRFSPYVLRNLHPWIGDTGFEKVDCLHWNAGLWDCLNLFQDGPQIPIEMYEQFIERICRRIRLLLPDAKVIFATSTPVDTQRYKNPQRAVRYNREIEAYNAVAVKVVTRYGFAVNDLYALLKDVPATYHSDATHYYTKEATKIITEQVLSAITSAIGVEGKELDYDALFATPDQVLGI